MNVMNGQIGFNFIKELSRNVYFETQTSREMEATRFINFSVTIISQIWKVDRTKYTRVFATVMSDMQWLHEVLAQSFFLAGSIFHFQSFFSHVIVLTNK